MDIKVGDIVQINESRPDWTGSLLIVDDVKEHCITAGMKVPYNGIIYVRLKHEEYEPVGRAVFVEDSISDKENKGDNL